MAGRLFLIHWNEAEAQTLAEPLIRAGWQVELEAEDGGRVSARLLEQQADVVVIYLTRLPSHGRETARHIRTRASGRSLPIIFVAGAPEAVAKTQRAVPDGRFVAPEELLSALDEAVAADSPSRAADAGR